MNNILPQLGLLTIQVPIQTLNTREKHPVKPSFDIAIIHPTHVADDHDGVINNTELPQAFFSSKEFELAPTLNRK